MELQETPIIAINENILNTSKALLKNHILIVFILPIIFKKTKYLFFKFSLHNAREVFRCLDILKIFFLEFKKMKAELPPTFDFALYLDALFKILQSDDYICIEKVLWYLYYTYSFLPRNFFIKLASMKLELWNFIFPKMFIKFFVHWSWGIRIAFYKLILYCILNRSREKLDTNLQKGTNPLMIRKEIIWAKDKRNQIQEDLLIVNFL